MDEQNSQFKNTSLFLKISLNGFLNKIFEKSFLIKNLLNNKIFFLIIWKTKFLSKGKILTHRQIFRQTHRFLV
jgi:hypothetical protein